MDKKKPNALRICIETFEDDAGYVAWIDNENFKGMVVQCDTLRGVLEELLTSFKVKIACDLGLEIGGMEEKVEEMLNELGTSKEIKKDVGLVFA